MSAENLALVQCFVEDCREHLDSIEASLMDIEAAGEHQDPELVNSVFRLAHSIKGGAGMLGLDNIKTLAHKLENVLHMVRSRELVATHEVVDVLLKGFDRLTHLVDNIEQSEAISIDEQVGLLLGLTRESDAVAAQAAQSLRLDAVHNMDVDLQSLEQARAGGNDLYLIELDLIHDIHGNGRMPFDLLKTLTSTGRIVDCKLDFEAVGDLDAFGNSIPFYILYATILEPDFLPALVKLPPERVRHLGDVASVLAVASQQAATPAQAPAVPSSVAAPAPGQESEERFGPVRLLLVGDQGTVYPPAEIGEEALSGLKAALLAGIARCAAVRLDVSGVSRCDLFFLQLLLCAARSYAGQGRTLSLLGAFDAELDHAREMQGFAALA